MADEARPALDLCPDGTIVLDLGEETIRLRRPTLGEFRRWRMELSATAEDVTRSRANLDQADAADRDDDTLSDDERVARSTERRLGLDDRAEQRQVDWWADVFKTLYDGEPPSEDSWPPFLIYGDQVLSQVLGHWRAVPLAPGPKSNRPN